MTEDHLGCDAARDLVRKRGSSRSGLDQWAVHRGHRMVRERNGHVAVAWVHREPEDLAITAVIVVIGPVAARRVWALLRWAFPVPMALVVRAAPGIGITEIECDTLESSERFVPR